MKVLWIVLSARHQRNLLSLFVFLAKKGVTRNEMKYVNGRVFHPECFEQHGNEFTVINPDLVSKNASAKN